MKTAPVADVEAHFGAYLELVTDEPLIITRDGRPVAALIAITDDDEAESLVLTHNPEFRRLLEDAHERIMRSGGLSEEDFWKAVEAARHDAQIGPPDH